MDSSVLTPLAAARDKTNRKPSEMKSETPENRRFSYSALLILAFLAAGNGQDKTQSEKGLNERRTIADGQPKIKKTQGADQFDEVRCGLQDKAGNLWFGTTRQGVYRYDGKLFSQFTVKDGLSHNTVWSIVEDDAGNIWFGTDSGLSRYDGKTFAPIPITVTNGVFFYSNTSPAHDPSQRNEIWSISKDKSGRLWFGTRDGVYCYNGTFFTVFLDDVSLLNSKGLRLKMVDCMLEDKDGTIWFGSGMPPGGEGVCRYDGKSLTSFKPNGDGWIRNLVEDRNGTIWLSTRHNGVWRSDGKTFTKFTEKEGLGTPMLLDKEGNTWFSGEEHENGFEGMGGVWRYDGKSFRNFGTKDGLGNYGVWCMLQDRSGNIWVGTRNTGLYRYDGKTFTSFSE